MPKAPPLPTGLFVNHGLVAEETCSQQIVETSITVEQSLQSKCEDIRRQCEARGLYHVNAAAGEGIYSAFEDFVSLVLEDQEENHRNEDVVDDLWDESIKIKQRKSAKPPPQVPPVTHKDRHSVQLDARKFKEPTAVTGQQGKKKKGGCCKS